MIKAKERQIAELRDMMSKNRHEEKARTEIDEYRYISFLVTSLNYLHYKVAWITLHYRTKIIEEQEHVISEKEREVKLCIEKLQLAIENIDSLNDEIRDLENQLKSERYRSEKLIKQNKLQEERLNVIMDKYHQNKSKHSLRSNQIHPTSVSEREDMDNYFDGNEDYLSEGGVSRDYDYQDSPKESTNSLSQNLQSLKNEYKKAKSKLNHVVDGVDHVQRKLIS